MLKQGVFGIFATIVVVVLGAFLIVTEPSPVRWMGLLAIFGGFLLAIRTWAALSIHAEDTTGQQPSWHIQRVLAARDK